MLDRFSELLGEIGGYAVVAMAGLVTLNVLTRGLANYPIPGFYEIVGLIGAVFYTFGIVYAALKGQHIVMSFVLVRLPERVQRICKKFSKYVVVLFSLLFAYAGTGLAWDLLLSGEKTDDLGIPIAPFRFLVVIAFVFLSLLILAGKEIAKDGE